MRPSWSAWVVVLAACADADGDGFRGGKDCDDEDSRAFAGGVEVCDGVDNDCDGQIDEDVSIMAWQDRDGDGFGDPLRVRRVCRMPADGVENGDDCDDQAASAFPGGVEVCDGLDNDCNGQVDDGPARTYYLDADGDGHGVASGTVEACAPPDGYAAAADDCDDAEPLAWTGAVEVCDGVDNDCDEAIDEELPLRLWPVDADGDGFGDAVASGPACGPVPGFSANRLDCDDADPALHPDTPEVAGNRRDDDCDAYEDELELAEGASVQAAVDAAAPGDVVQLGPFVYEQDVNLGASGVTLAGEGCERSVLLGTGAGATLVAASGRVQGMTITGGTAAGLRIEGDVEAERLCVVANDNESFGGGIDVRSGRFTLQDSLVADNLSLGDGGGMQVEDAGTFIGRRVRFIGNTAQFDGGALAMRAGDATITASVFASNQAGEDGGAVVLRTPGGVATTSETSFTNCTFDGNVSIYNPIDGDYAYGLAIASVNASARFTLKNSVFTGHTWVPHDPETPVLYSSFNGSERSYLAFWDNQNRDDKLGWEIGALRAAPRYVSREGDPRSWDHRLGLGSAFIDAGDPALLDPDGSRSDLGAYGGPDAPADFDRGYRTDADGDGLLDVWEERFGLAPWRDDSAEDPDGDDLDNTEEQAAGTSPADADSDDDGTSDGAERAAGRDPLDPADGRPFAALRARSLGVVGEPSALDARTSFDPDGVTWTGAWSVEAPGGVAPVTVAAPADAQTSFVPTAPGVWRVHYTVTDGGLTSTATAVIEVSDALIVPDDADSVADALSILPPDTIVAVRPGVWPVSEVVAGRVTVVGLGEAGEVELDGEGAQVWSVTAGGLLTLEGLTVLGGAAARGGGIGCDNGAVDLRDLVISGNHATDAGGGAALIECDAWLTDVLFDDNTSPRGAGLLSRESDLVMVRGGFSANTASDYAGGLWMDAELRPDRTDLLGTGSLRNVVFDGNTAPTGAAVRWEGQTDGFKIGRLSNLVFARHLGVNNVFDLVRGRVSLQNSLFLGNFATWLVQTADPDDAMFQPLYAGLWLTGGGTWSDAEVAPREVFTADPKLTGAGVEPWSTLWSLRPDSPLHDVGLIETPDLDGSRAALGNVGGPWAAPWWRIDGVDGDADGMSDGWELAYGLNPRVNDAAADRNGDGFSNGEAYRLGGVP